MTDQKKLNEAAQNTLSEVQGIAAVDGILADLDHQEKEEAKLAEDQAVILTEAQSAADNAFKTAPFTPDKSLEPLFDQIDVLTTAVNDMDNGLDEADRRHLEKLKERDRADEWNPEAVIDEKIKEEQREGVQQDLRNEIDEDLLGEQE